MKSVKLWSSSMLSSIIKYSKYQYLGVFNFFLFNFFFHASELFVSEHFVSELLCQFSCVLKVLYLEFLVSQKSCPCILGSTLRGNIPLAYLTISPTSLSS